MHHHHIIISSWPMIIRCFPVSDPPFDPLLLPLLKRCNARDPQRGAQACNALTEARTSMALVVCLCFKGVCTYKRQGARKLQTRCAGELSYILP